MIVINRRRAMLAITGTTMLVGLGACGGQTVSEPPVKTKAWTPLRLAVGGIEVVDTSTIEPTVNFVGRRRIEDLRNTTKDYLTNRFVAAGGELFARTSIVEARLIERPLPVTEGIEGVFKSEADTELDSALAVRMTILDGLGLEQGFAQARVSGTRKVSKRASVVERDAIAKTLSGELVDRLDQSLREAIEQHLGEFIVI